MLSRSDVKFAIEKRYKVKVPSKLHNAIATTSAQQIPILPQPPVSTFNYKANLALIKKA
jgi:hypothetical protein